MSRKNNRAKDKRHNDFVANDEAARIAKNKKRNDARKRTVEMRERGLDPLKERKNAAKKAKVAPIVASDVAARKMQKMMKKMNIAGAGKKGDSSDWETDSAKGSGDEMDVDQAPVITKTIKKRKPLPRSYYQALKKSMRRQAKAEGAQGMKDSIDKLDEMLAELQNQN